MKREYLTLTLVLFKYLPVIGVILCCIFISHLIISGNKLVIQEDYTGNAFITLVLILFIMCNVIFVTISYLLSFCNLHRKLFYYQTLVSICIAWEHFIGFGSLLLPMRILVLTAGIALQVCLVANWTCFHSDKPSIKGTKINI